VCPKIETFQRNTGLGKNETNVFRSYFVKQMVNICPLGDLDLVHENVTVVRGPEIISH
jgi:hypothetical protein